MTLDITAGENAFGDFSDKEIRILIFETAQSLYRPAHDVLVAAHAETLVPERATKKPGAPSTFDDAALVPVWAACLARARAHVADMLGMDLAADLGASVLPSPQTRGTSGGPRDKVN